MVGLHQPHFLLPIIPIPLLCPSLYLCILFFFRQPLLSIPFSRHSSALFPSVGKMGKQPDTELTVLDVPSRSTTCSIDGSSEERSPGQKDLIYVEGEKNDSGPVGFAIARLWKRRNHGLSLDDVATQPSVFDDERLAPLNEPGPEYENVHRFDPKARWTWREEIPLIRKIDWRVTAWAAIGKRILAELPEASFLHSGILSKQCLQHSSCSISHVRTSSRRTRITSWTISALTRTISTPPSPSTALRSCVLKCLLSSSAKE